jgi:hypothetical protein
LKDWQRVAALCQSLQVWQRRTRFGKGEQAKPPLTENSVDYSPQALPAVSNFANPCRFGKGEQAKPPLTENSMDYSPQALPAVSNFANPYRFGKEELGLAKGNKPSHLSQKTQWTTHRRPRLRFRTLPILTGLAKEN